MFDDVLVGVDGRPGGRDAIALASRLRSPDGRLTLAHVHGGQLAASHAISPGVVATDREARETLLERELAAADLATGAELIGIEALSPGRALHQQAEEQGADLIVVGSCGRGVLGCAVAIARLGYAEHPTPFAKIGVGYDGSPESTMALETARTLAAPTRASVHVLEVLSLPSYAYMGVIPPITGEGIEAMLQEANDRLRELPDVEAHAVCGLTGEELAQFGEDVDLLVVGSRGYGPLKRLVLGSTSAFLQRHARCSLLVLPRAALATARGADEAFS